MADASAHLGNEAVVIDATHIVVVQDQDVAFWENGTWTTHPPPAPPYLAPFRHVVARSITDVWISSPGYRYHWNGATWTLATEVEPSGSMAIYEAPTGDLFVGDGDAQVSRWNGSWTSLTTGPGLPAAVWGTANTDIWAIGESGYFSRPFAVHWDGAAWTSTPLPASDSVNAIWGTSPNNYWIAAGDYHGQNAVERVMLHWDGTAWSRTGLGEEDPTNSPGMRTIWPFAANDIFAASPYALYHYDGTSWSPITVPTAGISDVFGPSASDLYVVYGATLAHWNGTAWTTRTAPVGISHGAAISASDIWLAGYNSLTNAAELVHYDGVFFVKVADLATLNGSGPLEHGGDIYTSQNGGLVKRPGTFGGTATSVASGQGLLHAWFAPDGHLYAIDRVYRGLLVHSPL